jgi:hypothetical protein
MAWVRFNRMLSGRRCFARGSDRWEDFASMLAVRSWNRARLSREQFSQFADCGDLDLHVTGARDEVEG